MSRLKRQKIVEIDGKTFTLTALSFEDSLELLPVAHKVMTVYDSELTSEGGLFLFAVLQGALEKADLDKLVEVFAKGTLIEEAATETPDGAVCPGRAYVMRNEQERKKALNEVFGGQLELMFPWLDAAFELNFAGTMGKMRGALEHMARLIETRVASKAEPKSE
jgi:hypothetical protein